MHAKNQDRSPCKISRYRQFFSAGFISVLHNLMPYFHFRCATFDRHLIHSADTCFLVMACSGYSHVQLKTLLSVLKGIFAPVRTASQPLFFFAFFACMFTNIRAIANVMKIGLRRRIRSRPTPPLARS